MNISVLLAFLCYFTVLLVIGLLSHKKIVDSKDYIVGNRSLNYWLTALSAHASDMSAWLFMALPASFFLYGLPSIWIATGLVVGMFLNWQIISSRLRKETERLSANTLSTYFEKRLGDDTGLIRALTAVLTLIFLSSYLSAGLMAMGFLFESIFGINYYAGLLIASFCAMTYTYYGGFVTVAWTDCFQAVFLLFMIILVPFVAFFHIDGGYTSIINHAENASIPFYFIEDTSIVSLLTIVMLMLSWGLGYFGQPHIITKFMGIKNPDDLKKATFVGIGWQILAMGGACLSGIVAIGYFQKPLENPELVFVLMTKELFHPFFAGFILCGIIAANISTMDSQMLVAGSTLSEDLLLKFSFKNLAKKAKLIVLRFSVIFITLLSLLIAFSQNSTVLDTVFFAWSGLGCCFGPLVLCSLYAKKINRQGALSSLIVGGFIALFWPLINPIVTSITIPTMIPGYLLGAGTLLIISRLTWKESCAV